MDDVRPAHDRGTRSRAALAGHPFHPMLVVVPIGAVIATLVFDIAHAVTDTEMWAEGARALLVIALVGIVPSALTGLIDFLGIAEARRHRAAFVHLIGNLAVVTPLLVVDLVVRLDDPVAGLRWEGLVLTSLATLALAVTGWAGGELAYRHGIGVAARQPDVGLPARSRSDAADAGSREVVLAEQEPAEHAADRELARRARRPADTGRPDPGIRRS